MSSIAESRVEALVQAFLETLTPYTDTIFQSGYDREHMVFWAIGVFVVLLILCSIVGKLISENDRVARSQELDSRIKDLGMPNFPFVQDTPIFYNGIVSVLGSATDPDFEIFTMDQPLLKRDIKVLCWVETSRVSYHQNGEIVGSGRSYKYSKEWISTEKAGAVPDSSCFNDKAYNLNRTPSLTSRIFSCNIAKVGPYKVNPVDLAIAIDWKQFTDMFKYEAPVARVDPEGIWSYEESTNRLIR